MNYDIPQPIPQGGNGAQDAEDSRITEIANELERLCRIHEAQRGAGQSDVVSLEDEQRVAEQMAKAAGYWIPMSDVFDLGVPGPSGNENDTYVADKYIYKVNNLFNSGSITGLLRKIWMHNQIFPETAYSFCGFCGFDGRTVLPVIRQARVSNARPATSIMIDTYMVALGFQKTDKPGYYINDTYKVWDVLPRNVLADSEGDIFVVDAEIALIQ
ncbi:MAG: hypothetical protein J6P66_08975 [Bacteroidaceae bacterium]|nr:hypothetical protein [Bacteroidaceae bacterium]